MMSPFAPVSGTSPFPLGLGTWRMAENDAAWETEREAMRYALERGINLIDTAEMYAAGRAETLVGEAVQGRRDDVCIVSKALPHRASRKGIVRACESSLKHLNTDWIDVYLLHWAGRHPFAETLEGLKNLKEAGKIRAYGVSNLDTEALKSFMSEPGGENCVTDQILYNPLRREAEWDLLPFCREKNMPVMAYAPLEQGRLLKTPLFQEIGEKHGVSAAAAALAWHLSDGNILPIPKAGTPDHVEENLAALHVQLDTEDHARINHTFPLPESKKPVGLL